MTVPTPIDVKHASTRLFCSLATLMAALLIFLGLLFYFRGGVTIPAVLIAGALGAFISLQRRLKLLSAEDLQLINESLVYTWLAPMAGAVMAGVIYLLFISNLLAGSMFPVFGAPIPDNVVGFARLLYISSDDPADYAKLLFWCFVAGFSECFVTDIIGRFRSQAALG